MNTMDILKTSLERRGLISRTLFLGESKKSFTQFSVPGSQHMVTFSTESPLYPFTSSSARLIANFKNFAYDLASLIDVSFPDSVTIYAQELAFEKAEILLKKHGLVIVKPNSSSVSNGLTLNIRTVETLHNAIKFARNYSQEVLVQRQVSGDEIRFTVIDGKVRAAILRLTPGVVGDGKQSLKQLIASENSARSLIVDTAVPYPAIDSALVDLDSFDLDVIPGDGERIELGKGTMIRLGASIYDIVDAVDPTYSKIAEKLAAQLGRGFVVVDIMIQDYKQPADDHNYAFIEFNLTPALQLFYSCRDGKHFDVVENYLAPMIAEVLQKESK